MLKFFGKAIENNDHNEMAKSYQKQHQYNKSQHILIAVFKPINTYKSY